MKYQIFAAHVWNNKHILLNYDFTDKEVRRDFLDSVLLTRKMNANINSDLTVTENDKIVTLSTCTGNKTERYLVQGVLIYDSRYQ